jgi:hypothetical protein
VRVTVTGAIEVADHFDEAAARFDPEAEKVVGKGSNNVKKDAQRIIRGASHRGYLPHYPYSITYDVTSGEVIAGEIGPDSGRLQGGLGRLLENGSQNNAPIPHLAPALDLEAPKFEKAAGDLAEKLAE